MKICVIGTRGFPKIQGGVEKHCEMLYTSSEDSESEYIVFRRKPYIQETPQYKNIRFIDLPSTKIKGFEAVFHSLIATIYSLFIRPDVVHIHNIGPTMFAPLLKLFRIKVVMTYHSPNYEHDKWGFVARNILKFSEYIAFKCCNKIIYVNKFQMGKAPARIAHKCVYVPNGINPTHKSTKTEYIQSLGLEPQNYVLAVGRITPEKGFDILVKAFANTSTNYKLVIAGGVETEAKYYNQIKSLIAPERIVFAGYVFGEELNQLYSNAALFVLSSRNEGFPIVLLEAMSYNLDVIVSDIPATHLVDLNEDDYYPTEDYKRLATQIEKKLAHRQIRCFDLKAFNWKEINKQTTDVYR